MEKTKSMRICVSAGGERELLERAEQGVQFEHEYATYVGVEHAISCSNGTVALELALRALDIQPGDEVIVTPRSFVASASAVLTNRRCAGIHGCRSRHPRFGSRLCVEGRLQERLGQLSQYTWVACRRKSNRCLKIARQTSIISDRRLCASARCDI